MPDTFLLRTYERNQTYGRDFTPVLFEGEVILSIARIDYAVTTAPPLSEQWAPAPDPLLDQLLSGGVGSTALTDAGTGYTPNAVLPLDVQDPPLGGTPAVLTAAVDGNGVVAGPPTIVDPGSGYLADPAITFPPPVSGTTATGTASILFDTISVTIGDGTQQRGEWRRIELWARTQVRDVAADLLLVYTDQ